MIQKWKRHSTNIIIVSVLLLLSVIVLLSTKSFSLSEKEFNTPIRTDFGIFYDEFSSDNITFNRVIYSYPKNFEESIDVVQENNDILLSIKDTDAYKIILSPVYNTGKKTIANLQLNQNFIYSVSTQTVNDTNGQYIKFSWNLQNVENYQNLQYYEIVIEAVTKYETTETGFIIDNVLISFRDLIESGYKIEKYNNTFRILSGDKSINVQNIELDPTVTGENNGDCRITSALPNTVDCDGLTETFNDGSTVGKIVMFWDVNSLPWGVNVTSSTVDIFLSSGSSGDTLSLYPIKSGLFNIDGVTWNNRTTTASWTTAGLGAGTDYNNTAAYVSTVTSDIGQHHVFTVTAWMRETLKYPGTQPDYGWLLVNSDSSSQTMHMDDSTTVSRRPVISITYTYPEPDITLTPANGTVTSNSNITLTCVARIDNKNPGGNISVIVFDVYWYNTTSANYENVLFQDIDTNTTMPNGTVTGTTTVNATNSLLGYMPDGTYNYYCGGTVDLVKECSPSCTGGNTEPVATQGWAPLSYTLILDTTKPLIQYVSPTETSATYLNRNYVLVNVTATDSSLSNITIRLFNSTRAQINSSNSTTSPLFINFSGLSDGQYFFNATAVDQLNNQNSTETRNITIDRTFPLVSYGTGTENNGVNVSGTNVYVNVSITETNFANVTFLLYNSSSQVNKTTFSTITYNINWTNLPNQNYTYNVTVTDLVNNINTTDTRRIKLDTVKPGVTIVNPVTGSYYTTSSIIFNVTLNDDGGIVQYTLNSGTNNFSMSSTNLRNYNATNTSIADGAYTFKVYANDTAGNRNDTTSTTFTVDTIKPLLVINYPANSSNFSTTSVQVNFTATDTNLQACKSSANGGTTNTTRACTTGVISNFTNTYSEGLNTVFVYVNDSANNLNQSSVTFRVDTTAPNVTIAIPSSNGQNFSYQTNVNFTVSDSGVGLSACWWTKNSGVTNTTLTCGTNITGQTWSEGSTTVIVYANDTLNNRGSATRQFNTDTVVPLISYGTGTEVDQSNYTRKNIYVNVSVTEINERNITFVLYNSTSQYNSTLFTNANRTINWTNLADGVYSFNVTVKDFAGNTNTTDTRSVRVDSIAPSLTIQAPTSQNYRDLYSYNLSLNVSATDSGVGVGTYFYSLNGASNISFTPNITIIAVAGSNTLRVYANDTIGNLNTSSVIQFNLTFTPKINNINTSNTTNFYSRNDLQDGLVSWWKFDENNTNLVDSSIYSNNATLQGSAVVSSGKVGTGVFLNAVTSNVQAPDSNIYNFNTTGLTVSYWLKAPNGGGTRDSVSKYSTTGNNREWLTRLNTGGQYVFQVNSNGTSSPSGGVTSTTARLDDDLWHFVVGTYNLTLVSIYIDGVANGTVAFTGGVFQGTATINMGAAVSVGRFNGTIDEVRIYNKSLSAAEIQNLYYVTNPTFQEYANVTINATITDEDTSNPNLYYAWFVDGVSVLTGFAQNLFNYVFNKQSQIVQVNINDSNNYYVNQTFNITTTFVNPTINFTGQTPTNNTYQSTTSFIVNFTGTEVNLNRGWIQMNNVNYTATCSGTAPFYCNRTITGLADATYNYFAAVNDTVGNQNFTETRTITIDTITPLISYASNSETDGVNVSRSNIFVNTTITEINFANITFKLYNTTSQVNVTTYSTQILFINWTSLADNDYTYNVTVTDLVNKINTTSTRRIRLDTTAPNGTLLTPSNNTFSSNVSNNFTLNGTDNLGIRNVTLNIYNSTDSLVNSTVVSIAAGTTQSTIGVVVTLAEGVYKWFYKLFDWAGNSFNTQNNTITIDTTKPSINITYPLNRTYNAVQTAINYTVGDTNIQACWYSTNIGVTNTTVTCGTNVTGLSSGQGSVTWKVYDNDSAGNQNSSSVTFFVDSVFPTINFTAPTPNNASALGSNSTTINITGTELNMGTAWVELNAVNYTLSCIGTAPYVCNRTFTGLSDGSYNYKAYMNDTANNLNSTETRTFTVDVAAPTVTILYPITNNSWFKTQIEVNDSVTDLFLSACWWTKNNGGTNTTLTCGNNITGQTWSQGSNTVIVYANDTTNRIGSATITFRIDTVNPLIDWGTGVENNGANKSQSNIYFNVSYTETNLDIFTFFYATSPTACQAGIGIQQATNPLNETGIADGLYTYCTNITDLAGNTNVTSQRTIRLDTLKPIITIDQPQNTSYRDLYSLNYSLNVSISDSGAGEQSRFYSLNGGTNTTFTGNTSVGSLSPGSNTVTVYATDYANNTNSTSRTFSLLFTPKIDTVNVSNASTSYSRNDLQDGLVGWWKLDENNTNQIDSSVSSINGTVNGATFNPSGKIGGAYNFDGVDDYINVSTNPILDIYQGQFTISFWLNARNVSNNVLPRIMEKRSNFVAIMGDTTNARFSELALELSNLTGSNTLEIWSRGQNVTLNTWEMWTLTYNGTGGQWYKNGVANTNMLHLNISGVWTGTESNSSGFDQLIARRRTDVNRGLNGSLDELRIYNRTLSTSEIQQLYYITNPTFQEYANVTINVTTTDEDTAAGSRYYVWLVDGVQKAAGFAQTVFNWIFGNRNNIVTVNINDSNNYTVTQIFNITTTFVNPTINFTSPTPVNNSYQSSTSATINFTGTEINRQVAWITFNSINYTPSCIGTQPYYCNMSFSVADGPHTYTAYINDTVGNQNNTETRMFTVDTLSPLTIQFVSPTETHADYVSRNYLLVNVTATDTNLANITIFLHNSSTVNINQTTTATSPNYINFSSLVDGVYTFNATATDLANNKNSTTFRTVTIDTIKPLISYATNSETDGNNVSRSNIFINVSVTEINFRNITFRLHNTTSQVNVTTYTTEIFDINFTSLVNGNYTYNVTIFDDAGNSNVTTTRTIRLDTTNPNATLLMPTNNTYSNTSSNNLTANLSDNLGIKNTTLYIYNQTGLYTSGYLSWLKFNGTSQMTIQDTDSFSPASSNNQTTISFWVYMDNFNFAGQSSTAEYTNYFGKTAYSPNRCEYEFRMENSSGLDSPNYRPCRMSFYAFNSSCGLGAGANFQDNDTATSCNSLNNTWLFVTGRIDGTNIAIFKNGILRSEAPLSGYGIQLNNTSANLHIGADIDGGQWNGRMSRIRIYNSSLSAEEIAEIYHYGINENTVSTSLYNDTYLSFNGVNGYAKTNINVSSITNESSFIGWFYRNNNNSANTIIGSSATNELLLRLETNNDIRFWANASGGSATFTSASSNNQWTNFAVIYNNSNGNATLYVNGVLNSSKILTSRYNIDTNIIQFGQRGNSANPLNGSLDNLLIFNRMLNSSDVLSIYNIGRIGKNPISNPLLEYSFNNSKFVTFIDTSANSYNGTLLEEGVTFGNDGIVVGTRSFSIKTNPVEYLKLNENSGTIAYDSSGYGNNGTTSGTTWQNELTTSFLPNVITSTIGIVINLVDSVYTWFYKIFDWAGNSFTSKNNTLTVDTANPLINLTYPLNISYSTDVTRLNYTLSDTNIQSCWYSTNNGVTNTSLTCGNNVTGLLANQGSNTWLVAVNDTVNHQNLSRVTFFVDSINPTINFTNPTETHADYVSRNYLLVNVTATDTNLANITIFLHNSSTVNINQTTTATSPNYINFSSLVDGVYTFNATATDLSNNKNSTTFRTVTIDTIKPLISYATNSEIDGNNVSRSNIFINVSVTEINFRNITFRLHNTTSQVNVTTYTTETFDINFTSLVNGNYTYNVTIFDDAGNSNVTTTRTITLDTVSPSTIQFVTPTDAHADYLARNYILVNVTATDAILANITIFLHNSSTVNINQSTTATSPNYINFSGLVDNVYTFNATATDLANNKNSTTFRTVTIDTTKPLITYASNSESDGNNVSRSYIFINVSVTEINFKNITFRLHNATSQVNVTTYTTEIFDINFTSLANSDYTYNVTIFDDAGNSNVTATRTIRLDTTNPNATLLTPSNNSYNSTTSQNLTANVTDNLGIKNYTLNIYNTTSLVNQTTVSNTNGNVVTQTVGIVINLVDNVYTWFYKIFDWAGNSFTSQNNTITIDTINPSISYDTSTTANGTWLQSGNVTINVTVSDTNLNTVQFQWSGANETFDNQASTVYWEHKNNLATGTYLFYAWARDSAGNINITAQRTANVDRENPSIDIVLPISQNYNTNTSIPLNYTVSDVNIQACWYNFDNGANKTLTCGQNTTFNISEATHTVYMFANDSSGRVGTDNVTFSVNLAPPSITLSYPLNGIWLNYSQNIPFNYTPTDSDGISSCRLYGDFTGTQQLNQTDTTITSGVINQFFLNLSSGDYLWNVFCNDTGNNGAWGNPSSNETFYVDTIYPLIDYGVGVYSNQQNVTANSLFVNVTVTESDEKNITFNLYNATALINSTVSTSGLRSINYTGLQGLYSFNVTIYDYAGNKNVTSTRTVRLDNTGPTITIYSPDVINYAYNTSLLLNTTITDDVMGVDKCWFNVKNETGNVFYNNTIYDCINTTFSVPGGDIDYTVIVYANDTLNNTENFGLVFGVRTLAPAVVLNNPTTGQHFNRTTNIRFNITATDREAIDTCQLYGNWTGTFALNQTDASVTSGTVNNFNLLNLTEGTFLWNTYCNDTNGIADWAQSNLSFTTDITYPNVQITTANNSGSGKSITFNYNITDTHSSTCLFNLKDSGGSWVFSPNQSLTCSSTSKSTSVVSDGTYQLYIWGRDSATNENSSFITLVVTTPAATTTTGGGGVETVGAVGNKSWDMTTEQGGDNYVVNIVRNGKRDRDLRFINNEATEIEITLRCEGGDICNYAFLEADKLTLPVGLDIESPLKVSIELEDEVENGQYVFSIIGKDQDGQEKLVTFTLNVGTAGIPIEVLTKIGTSTEAFGITLPYAVIALTIGIIVFALFNFVILRKQRLGMGLSIVLGLFAGILSLIFIP